MKMDHPFPDPALRRADSSAPTLIKSFFKRSFWLTAIIAVSLSVALPILRYLYDVGAYKQESLAIIARFIEGEHLEDTQTLIANPADYDRFHDTLSSFMRYSNLVDFKIWRRDATVLFAYSDRALIGKKFTDNEALAAVLKNGQAKVEIEEMVHSENINLRRFGKLLEMYAPVSRDGAVVAVVEVYRHPPRIQFFGIHNLVIATMTLAVPALLYFLLFGQFKKATAEILRYQGELGAAYDSLASTYFEAVRGLIKALELRDIETKGHAERVVAFALAIGKRLGLGEEESGRLVLGSYLHDIGKIGISDLILLKPGKLTPEERAIMETHVGKGYGLVKEIDFLQRGAEVVRYHHEKWDGSGYGAGLQGTAIPITARIFALVDVYDALRSKRPYKEPFSYERTRAIIQESRATHFDPAVVDAFLGMSEAELDAIAAEVHEHGIHSQVSVAIASLLQRPFF